MAKIWAKIMRGERQKKVLEYIKKMLEERGIAPTIEEIARHLGVTSTATVHKHLRALERKGLIERGRGWRQIRLKFPVKRGRVVPLLGFVPAGGPIEVFEAGDEIEIPEWLVERRTGELFALRVEGKSMIDAYVDDGDIIIVEKSETAEPGEMVVAYLPDKGVTLKRLRKVGGRLYLFPENPDYEPIEARDLKVLGRVVGIIRRY